jgi:general secretion pathway protein G
MSGQRPAPRLHTRRRSASVRFSPAKARPSAIRVAGVEEAGFTLIEIMVVVVILGILAAIVVPRIVDRPDQARQVKVQQDLRGIGAALELYRLDHAAYPATQDGLVALVASPGAGRRYLDRVPKDPWGRAYHYQQPGQHGEYDIYTLGADGQEGGTGSAADVGSWDLD